MLIRHLRFFVTLAEERHFGRAAQACNITQPTLSQAIRKLEEDLNIALIARGHRFMSLTPEGYRVLQWGQQILDNYDSLRADLGGRKGGLTGTLRLGVVPAAMPAVSFLSETFIQKNPRAQVEIRSMSSRAIQTGLDSFEIDGGITYLENEPLEHVQQVPLYHEHYAFACNAGHPLARQETVRWADAVKQPLCLLSEDMQNRRILNAVAASAGVELHPKVTSNSFLAVASHLRSGSWCAIVPHTFGVVFGGTDDVVMRKMVDPVKQQLIGLVLPERLSQSLMVRALQESMQHLSLEHFFSDFASQ